MIKLETKDGIRAGDFVLYRGKDEMGLVSEVITPDLIRCWWHMGGTRARIDVDMVERLTEKQARTLRFTNEYAKKSLFERSARMIEGKDVSDLIDDDDIRMTIKGLNLYE